MQDQAYIIVCVCVRASTTLNSDVFRSFMVPFLKCLKLHKGRYYFSQRNLIKEKSFGDERKYKLIYECMYFKFWSVIFNLFLSQI